MPNLDPWIKQSENKQTPTTEEESNGEVEKYWFVTANIYIWLFIIIFFIS
jgi:hypothetical protein